MQTKLPISVPSKYRIIELITEPNHYRITNHSYQIFPTRATTNGVRCKGALPDPERSSNSEKGNTDSLRILNRFWKRWLDE
uniref:Uncharacterized protein n=1 Tax=Parascaris univalens TaxID=6257 RepID=A0A914ZWN9_PARUN